MDGITTVSEPTTMSMEILSSQEEGYVALAFDATIMLEQARLSAEKSDRSKGEIAMVGFRIKNPAKFREIMTHLIESAMEVWPEIKAEYDEANPT